MFRSFTNSSILIGLVTCGLGITISYASGTYFPPATSYVPNEMTSGGSVSRNPNLPNVPNRPAPPKKQQRLRTKAAAVDDNLYNRGKKIIFSQRSHGPMPGCISCHSGAIAFNREHLLGKNLAQSIQNCKGPHAIYCQNGISAFAMRSDPVVYALNVRYNLRK